MQALKENPMQPECGNQSGWDPLTQICIFFSGLALNITSINYRRKEKTL